MFWQLGKVLETIYDECKKKAHNTVSSSNSHNVVKIIDVINKAPLN